MFKFDVQTPNSNQMEERTPVIKQIQNLYIDPLFYLLQIH